MTSQRVFSTLLLTLLLPACWPGQISDGGEISDTDTGSGGIESGETSPGDGDGDGDPGDGDGDFCGEAPTIVCTDEQSCWASDPGWTAEAAAATAQTVGAILQSGIWVPVNLGIGEECWALSGGDVRLCIVDICGEHLLGRPATDIPLEPSVDCDFVGAWESTATAYDTCFGVIDGVAVELRDAAEPFHAGEVWGPCPTTIDGIPTLCNSESVACVPADFAEANICLPIGGCPAELPDMATAFEPGWGDACYPRCDTDDDCIVGMVCGTSVADDSSMCAWPR
jgi:hypothetical protein